MGASFRARDTREQRIGRTVKRKGDEIEGEANIHRCRRVGGNYIGLGQGSSDLKCNWTGICDKERVWGRKVVGGEHPLIVDGEERSKEKSG